MRFIAFGLLAVLAAAPAAAQDAPGAGAPEAGPAPGSTFVVPALPGEPVRLTTYAERPAERGRLAARYRGLRVDRAVRVAARPAHARPVLPVVRTPRGALVPRAGSFFPVVGR